MIYSKKMSVFPAQHVPFPYELLRDQQLSLTCPSNTPVTVIYLSVPIIKIKGTLPSWRMQGTEQESCHLLAQEATKPVWQR